MGYAFLHLNFSLLTFLCILITSYQSWIFHAVQFVDDLDKEAHSPLTIFKRSKPTLCLNFISVAYWSLHHFQLRLFDHKNIYYSFTIQLPFLLVVILVIYLKYSGHSQKKRFPMYYRTRKRVYDSKKSSNSLYRGEKSFNTKLLDFSVTMVQSD